MPKHPRHLSTRSATQLQRQKRRRRAVVAGTQSEPAAVGATVPAAAPAARVRSAPVVKTAPSPKPSKERYGYVANELRWIGAMVGAVAVILVILSFVIPRMGL